MKVVDLSTDKDLRRPVVLPLASSGLGPLFNTGIVEPYKVSKSWGDEKIFSNDLYCLKVLTIAKGKKTSMHFHPIKKETILVIHGTLGVDYIRDGKENTIFLDAGESIVVAPNQPHRFYSIDKEVVIVEASTQSKESDSIRINI